MNIKANNIKNIFEEEEEGGQNATPEIIKVYLSSITPHPISLMIYDSRTGRKTIKFLAKTMDFLGQFEPIKINTDNQIISGVRRYRAALFLGWTEIDAIKVPKREDEADTIVFHNQQRRKTPNEIIHEAEAILGILGKNQGARRDLIGSEPSNPFGKIGRASLLLGRRYIGYELNNDNFTLGLQDLNNCLTEVNERDLESIEKNIEKKEVQSEPSNPNYDDFFADF